MTTTFGTIAAIVSPDALHNATIAITYERAAEKYRAVLHRHPQDEILRGKLMAASMRANDFWARATSGALGVQTHGRFS